MTRRGCASSSYDRRRRIEDIGSKIRSGRLSSVFTDDMFNARGHSMIVPRYLTVGRLIGQTSANVI